MIDRELTYGQEATEAATFGNFPIYKDAPPEDALTPTEAADRIAEPVKRITVDVPAKLACISASKSAAPSGS
jgi:hypothetical protein